MPTINVNFDKEKYIEDAHQFLIENMGKYVSIEQKPKKPKAIREAIEQINDITHVFSVDVSKQLTSTGENRLIISIDYLETNKDDH